MSSEAQARAPGPHQQLGRVRPHLASVHSHRAPDSGPRPLDVILGLWWVGSQSHAEIRGALIHLGSLGGSVRCDRI